MKRDPKSISSKSLEVNMNISSTRDRIIDVAEELFSEYGIRGASQRQITKEANVNLSSINYYFGTKENLISEIFIRRSEPITRRRQEMLAECIEVQGRPPILEQIIYAFVRPALLPNDVGKRYMRLRAGLSLERDPAIISLFSKYFDPTTHLFIDKICEVLPHLSKEEVLWRFVFLVGSLIYLMANSGRIQTLSQGLCDPSDADLCLREFIPFLAAGFRSPSTRD